MYQKDMLFAIPATSTPLYIITCLTCIKTKVLPLNFARASLMRQQISESYRKRTGNYISHT